MAQKAHTKDEKFMICLYEASLEKGDLHAPFSRYEIGHKIGMHPKGANTTCVLLLQANFIKKGEGDDVFLTKNGEALVLRLLHE